MSEEKCGSGGIFLAVLAGGLIGAGIALLYAPAAGIDTRRKIRDMADDVKEKSEKWTSEIKQKMEGFVEEERAILKAAYDAGREAMVREKSKYEEAQSSEE
ncbi:MAG: YtxH domain-containing protein [Syntrophorhabdaceae bacterium]|jgi:gas vesicle protein|nr:YtxH domain-containing protein [Syntrophorhabdaceae bacterium]